MRISISQPSKARAGAGPGRRPAPRRAGLPARRRALPPAVLALLGAAALVMPAPAPLAAAPPAGAQDILSAMAQRFSWAPIEGQATVVQITVTGDPGGSWHLLPLDGGDVELQPGSAVTPPGFTCELDLATLRRLDRGELSGITAAGKDDAGKPSPLEILPGTAVPEDAPRTALAPVFHFLTHFFNRGEPERFRLGRDAARSLNGSRMVGLFYHPGFRSAWYSIRGDEVLNGDGDTTGYPQAFVFVKGRARLRYGQRWIDVEAGETIYVPPGVLHAIKSRDGGEVEIVWLAWGDGA